MKKVRDEGWQKVYDEERVGNYAYKDNQWVGFDDGKSIGLKGDYIRENGLAGAMVWCWDLDDFTGELLGGVKYPLLSTLHKRLL